MPQALLHNGAAPDTPLITFQHIENFFYKK
jgi:hypothetical protein